MKALNKYCISIMLFFALLMQFSALAQSSLSDLTVLFCPDGKAANDVIFSLYYVADEAFNLSGHFKNYKIYLANNEQEQWRKLSFTLESYATADGILPEYTVSTNASGIAEFENLPSGLYLGIGNAFTYEKTTYAPESFLVSLSGDNLTVEPKYSKATVYADTVSAVKIWKDNEFSRPKKITVDLYSGSEKYDSVKLTKSNSWRYVWNDLPSGVAWRVVEREVPDGYTVKIEKEDNRFVITNTAQTYSNTEPDQEGGGDKLPYTGMLWWPVPLLAGAGMLFVALGLILRRKGVQKD